MPTKIDIGPVFNVDPQKRAAYAGSGERAFAPVERELVFDVARPFTFRRGASASVSACTASAAAAEVVARLSAKLTERRATVLRI